MDVRGPDTATEAGTHPPANASTAPRSKTRSTLTRASDVLQDMTRIGVFYDNVPKNRRYADLKRDEMYRNLVDLYEIVFKTHWNFFDRIVTARCDNGAYANTLERYAASIYISSWFHDLYVSNRLAVRKLSDTAYVEHYYLDLVSKSHKYDSFLTALNAHIRPTIVKYTHEETLFVPRICENLATEAVDENYFRIQNYMTNDPLLQNILYTFEERKLVKMDELSETTLGRPSWLFDVHDSLAYAWFPAEGNYNMEDVALAFIVGTACTPKLGPRDYDEWQLPPGNVRPNRLRDLNLQRIRPISYHGHIEYRCFESRDQRLPDAYMNCLTLSARHAGTTSTAQATSQPSKRQRLQLGPSVKGKQPAESSRRLRSGAQTASREPTPEDEHEAESQAIAQTDVEPVQLTTQVGDLIYQIDVPVFHEVRIVDYIYHARLFNKTDLKSRIAAHRSIIYSLK